ncbi:protein of unknown function DUF21 [Cynara cardunculus var. scolymus]|uniref:CNNM transmembrane domain-containing protein n=1 Tax=Cynara cardunculus var. scolymus TaxID=59895 RepID=A0A103XMF5_CYNCS|nr:protein of unknown function DUF21 [Cynara cardunculus var. scolymus]
MEARTIMGVCQHPTVISPPATQILRHHTIVFPLSPSHSTWLHAVTIISSFLTFTIIFSRFICFLKDKPVLNLISGGVRNGRKKLVLKKKKYIGWIVMTVQYECCGTGFFLHIGIVAFLVLFAGLMSGLTLGLMSMSLVDLEVLAKSGTPKDRKYAALGAILISVTLILLFGEIIPQSVCTRHGLAIGATVSPFVRVLVCICFPIAYPISKLLDYLLGHEHVALFRRAELKTLVNFHGNEAGKGGELTHDETTIIAGALELTEKTASDAMTPISDTFTKGHSRVPVYYEQPTNIIGLILVKNMLTINADEEVPVKNVTIRRIPKVAESLPLYDILNEFQKGHSHMAVVVRQCVKTTDQPATKTLTPLEKILKTKRSFKQWKSFPSRGSNSFSSKKWKKEMYSDILEIDGKPLPKLPDEEAVGVITMEDVIEELLQEEIFDETDHQFDDL